MTQDEKPKATNEELREALFNLIHEIVEEIEKDDRSPELQEAIDSAFETLGYPAG